MSFSAVSQVGSLDIGSVLKIVSTNGVYNQLSDASEMWKMVLKKKTALPEGRQIQYSLQSHYGPAAVQNLPASAGDYPAAQRVGLVEGIAYYKDYGLTVSVQNTIIRKALNELSAYEKDVLQMEMDAKITAAARLKSAELYGDGTGVIGVLAAAPVDLGANTRLTISATTANADRSHIGWIQPNDRLKIYSTAGAAHDLAVVSGTVAYYEVIAIDEENNTIEVSPRSAAGATLTSDGVGTVVSGDYLTRLGARAQDWSAISASTDYANASYDLVGLGSLSQDDGRLVNGVTQTGALGGSRITAGGQIDSRHFQKVLSKVKRRVGKNRYPYKFAFMWDEVYDSLLEQSETDRRIMAVEDGSRGFKRLGYQHGKTFVEFTTDEFCPKQRIYLPPESKEVMEFRGTDFESVEPNKGQKFQLANAASVTGGHARAVQHYMEGSGCLLSRHPAALACIEDFTF